MEASSEVNQAADRCAMAPTARKRLLGEALFFTALLSLATLVNTYTVLADRARDGNPLQLWRPLVWEASSNLLVLLLVPALAWWLARFPLTRTTWWRSLPAHLIGTAWFSLVHTGGMVLLRRLAYSAAGERYDFGPFWDNWLYEYRKDFLTYWLLSGALLAFRVYGLWLDARAGVPAVAAAPGPAALAPVANEAPQGRLVVRKLNREFILDAADIDRLESDGNYVVVHAGGQTYRLRESLDSINRRLGEQRFARVHRTHVVNIDRIREIQPWDNGDYRILLKDGSFLNFSRRYRSRLGHLFR
jgi:hypothetical protein